MTIAEKAKAKALEIRENKTPSTQSQTIANIVGLTAEDLNMPYVYIVRDKAKFAKLSNGEKAPTGTYFHSVKKTASKEMEVMMAYAKKGKALVKELATDTEKEVDAWRALMVETSNVYSPFVMTFKQMNFWYGFKDLLSTFMAEGINDPQDVVIKMTTEEVSTQKGFENFVPKFEIVRKTTPDEKEVLKSIVVRFSAGLESLKDEETLAEYSERKQAEKDSDGDLDLDSALAQLDGKA